MEDFEILMGREHIEPKLLLASDPSLARVMGQLNMCTCFAGMTEGKNVVACLLTEHSNGVCEISNFALDPEYTDHGYGKRVLHHAMSHAREKGFRWMETGAGNSNITLHAGLMKMGFRVIGVWTDYYKSEGQSIVVDNGLVNLDMLRYRLDFQDGWVTWTEEVKQHYGQ